MRHVAFFAGDLDAAQSSEDRVECGKMVLRGMPLRGEFAVTVGDEDAAGRAAAGGSGVVAEKCASGTAGNVEAGDDIWRKRFSEARTRLIEKRDERDRVVRGEVWRALDELREEFIAWCAVRIEEGNHEAFFLLEVPGADGATIGGAHGERRNELARAKRQFCHCVVTAATAP
jgi:hypothetical protein